MGKFLMCLQEFTVQTVIMGHIVSHVIKCEQLEKNRMKMAFGHRRNLLHIASGFGEVVNFFASCDEEPTVHYTDGITETLTAKPWFDPAGFRARRPFNNFSITYPNRM